MHRPSRPEVLDLQHLSGSSAMRTRSRSSSVDNPLSSSTSDTSVYSTIGHPLTTASPEAAYIAPSAAARLVTADHESFFRTLHSEGIIGPGTPAIQVAEAPLRLVNQFLDFLLYSFLSVAKSTSLPILRQAVTEVLRARLANEAVTGADQELASYLGGDEEEEAMEDSARRNAEWDLEITWKRARLQCMVYSSLGDLEEDDEAFYSEYGRLEGAVGPDQYEKRSAVPGVVSPAVSIWLTSILEFIGEQTLLVAGHATIARYSAQRIAAATSPEPNSDVTFPQRPTVEELDAEKVALNPSLGRMWRQWRKKVRGGRVSFPIAARESMSSRRGRQTRSTERASEAEESSKGKDQKAGDDTQNNTASGAKDPSPVATPPPGGLDDVEKERLLTPIVESMTPGPGDQFHSEPDKQDGVEKDDGEKNDVERDPNNPLPSLIILPWTSESPFVLRWQAALKRPRSLPPLSRGDFADPATEGTELPTNVEHQEDATEENNEQAFYTPAEEKTNLSSQIDASESISEKEESKSRRVSSVYSRDQEGISFFDDEVPEMPVRGIRNEVVEEEEEAPHTKYIVSEDGNGIDITSKLDGKSTHNVNSKVLGEHATTPPVMGATANQNREATIYAGVSRAYDSAATPDHEHSCDVVVPARNSTTDDADNTARVHQSMPAAKAASRGQGSLAGKNGHVDATEDHDGRNSSRDAESAIALSDDGSASESYKDVIADGLSPGPSGSWKHPSHAKHASTSSNHSKQSQYSERKIGHLTLVSSTSSSHSVSSERGGGVRMFTPPTTPDKSRRSSSFSKGQQRPIHTSGSSSSQTSAKLKSLIPWQNESGKHPRVPESDTESRSSLHSSRGMAAMDEKERSFEELISSGDTIHCTITPDPIRNMGVQEMPASKTPVKTPTSELADFFRSTGPDGPPPRTSNKTPSSPRSFYTPTRGEDSSNSSFPHFLRPATSADLPQSSTSSFSSQPAAQGSKVQRMMEGASITSLPGSPKTGAYGLFPAPPGGITGIPTVMRQPRPESSSSSAIHQKNRLLAREASGSTGSDTTSALADFFRNTTPPVDGEQPGTHRISRSVAPFRNTMDSEQFDPAGDPADETESHKAQSFVTSSAPHESYQSSYTSSTALIRSNSRKNRDYGSTSSYMPETKRKQSRIKDPYAIDIDELEDDDEDDDDLDLLDLVIPKKKEEESLIDFLNSVPPPPPPPNMMEEEQQQQKRNIQKKSSSVSLMSRLTRNSSRKSSSASISDKIPAIPPFPGSKHVPLMADSPRPSEADHHRRPSLGPSLASARADSDSYRAVSSSMGSMSGRAPPRGAMARGARTERNDTDGLADFLKHTAPPASFTPNNSQLKDESKPSVLKMFSRNKKRSHQVGVM